MISSSPFWHDQDSHQYLGLADNPSTVLFGDGHRLGSQVAPVCPSQALLQSDLVMIFSCNPLAMIRD